MNNIDHNNSKIYTAVEEGHLFWYLIIVMVILLTVSFIISGFNFTNDKKITIFKKKEFKQYHIKKVSHIPQKKLKEESQKISVDDDKLSVDDIRKRYNSYIVTKIQRNKVYPLSEQKKGHEGSVLLKIYLFKNGTVQRVTILRQARYTALTQAAIKTIQKSLPFKSFPPQLPEEELVLTLEIHFNLY